MKHLFSLCMHTAEQAVYWKHIVGNKTRWILGAMAERYQRETGRPAQFVIDQEKQRLSAMMKDFRGDKEPEVYLYPVAAPAPSAPVAPKRGFDWVPEPADMQAGIYAVKPETFHTYNEGATHRIEVVMGPAYPYGDNWPGQFVAWHPGDINAPFVPEPGVLAAALAHDEARIAAILARRSVV